MKIETGDTELLRTETFLAIGLGETVITIDDGPESLRFILDFVASEENKETPAINWETIDGKTAKVTLVNWNNPLGTTLVKPVQVGTYSKRQLSVLFFISKAGGEGEIREVTFSLYLGKEVQ